ncbi:hypothetical protein GOARA_067_00180 [Gordonia araii NBRC 100433]|uniref:Uncharacterized protein n=1 Tax=Gordonia araii NBRC 100433 TaxID=1073574 RepID=G7H638_9ACTN|nr:lipase family protein [Gordonia araii]NNG98724.1 hypothetical protein [Gordonia araii NBRC 100433]GAB11277.1 hypothetical protein GOARA_067_00180 [Gordonia araii NBRC 100433]
MRTLTLSVGAALAVAGSLLTAPPASSAPATGTVLAQSAVPTANLPSGAARGVKVLYATRDQRGRPAQSTGVVYYPRGAAPAGGWKVVSWAHGTIGISAKCAPSGQPGKLHDRDQPDIGAALRRGYVVTASDYIGLGSNGTAEYLGGRSVAYNVIDMVRAARRVDPAIGKRWVSLGHSQGGHAAIWAARMAPRYAPELPMLGTVAIAPANQIETLIPALQRPGVPNLGSFNAMYGFGLYLMSGLDHARPGMRILDYLTPQGRAWVARARGMCVKDLARALKHVLPGDLYRRSTDDPRFLAAVRDYAGYPATGWHGRIRIQQGLADVIVFPAGTALLSSQLRAGGADASLVTYPGADHMAVPRRSMRDTYATVAGYFR